MFKSLPRLGADELAAAMVLTGHPHTPTPHELSAALALQFSNGTAPTIADLLAEGLLTYTIDRQRLRLPPSLSGKAWQGIGSTMSLMSKHGVTPSSIETAEKGIASEAKKVTDSVTADSFIEPDRLFSYFTGPITNTTPRASITVQQLHTVITNPPAYLRQRASAARVEYEANGQSTYYKELKSGLDYFTAGGVFTRRRDEALIKASGLLVLDFDHLNGCVEEARTALLADAVLAPAMALLFISPSGDGLKVVLAADSRHSRLTNYECLARYLVGRYGWGIKLDTKTADLSRACFLSYDPTAWLAPSCAAATSNVMEMPL